ncbi:hypothetical protein M2480_001255 [Parabacteroides sp. PFB2-12]|uniref:DUF4843 domain-containing protein n=1 Tax=unclassified Parabacteroides TaxID=2649774 RepID=UPI002472EB04|nr:MULTISPECIES: DUF4843 domain-containing protein [unclassified Parabacteroides]MDH6343266.1 hypothetical protein [Parabacteroides sp. PM6-13]MDH6390282.1 hypothetical protein [Parabacteroides sp. PFB2-12]
MKITKIIFLSSLFALLWTSCQNDGFYYQDEARVRLEGPKEWALETDSLAFSFAAYPSEITRQEMNMSLFVMGYNSPAERKVKLRVVSEKSTAKSSQYEMPAEVTIPANAYNANFTITLLRTEELLQETVRLYIEIEPSSDFTSGVIEQDHFLLKWNDVLSKPQNWDTELKEFFGAYSQTKHRFIIDTLAIGEFKDMNWAELNNYKIRMKNALTAYNQANPGNPLTDENGQLVTF